MVEGDVLVRIGELSRRVGVGTDRLRAWERRYGLLRPERTPGGFRLYSEGDERRVRDMQTQLESGLSAAEAARVVLAREQARTPAAAGVDLRARLGEALAAFDDAGAHAVLDRLLAERGADIAMRDVIYPYLRELGERWARAEIGVGQEHFASNLLQGRLLALVPGWDHGPGPRAVLACPPGELHTLGLVGLGVCLRNRGWRITYLGADTPIAEITRTAGALSPRAVVLAAAMLQRFVAVEAELRELAASAPLLLAGAGASRRLADAVDAELLDVDPVTAADRMVAG